MRMPKLPETMGAKARLKKEKGNGLGVGVFVGVDPGLAHTGLCVVDTISWSVDFATVSTKLRDFESEPERIRYIVNSVESLLHYNATKGAVLVLERMQIYDPRKSRTKSNADPNDLIPLAEIAGGLISALDWAQCFTPKPSEWKGNVPKKIHHKRLMVHIDNIIGRTSEHARDALGLALFGARRCHYQREMKKRLKNS